MTYNPSYKRRDRRCTICHCEKYEDEPGSYCQDCKGVCDFLAWQNRQRPGRQQARAYSRGSKISREIREAALRSASKSRTQKKRRED
jgi:hypothetical protein